MDREKTIDALWERSGHGTTREDIAAAFEAGWSAALARHSSATEEALVTSFTEWAGHSPDEGEPMAWEAWKEQAERFSRLAAAPVPAQATTKLYLCLDLAPADQDGELPEGWEARYRALLASQDISIVMTAGETNGPRWRRHWTAFNDRAAALLYAEKCPTLVVIPLEPQFIPLDQIPEQA